METYRFETAKFEIVCNAEPEYLDPADSFQFDDDIEFARSGDPAAWFCAIVTVTEKCSGAIIGRDVLGGCSYRSFEDFTESHRDPDPSNRNTLAMAAQKRAICHYFPSMINTAVAEARATIARLCAA